MQVVGEMCVCGRPGIKQLSYPQVEIRKTCQKSRDDIKYILLNKIIN